MHWGVEGGGGMREGGDKSKRLSLQGSELYTSQKHENEPPCIAQDAGVNCDKLVGITMR